ncbi:MAG: M20 family metallopeptidase, partial [Clostridia bacterium]|nr:M20 family metallopeptidase [Clostridia bacterium]
KMEVNYILNLIDERKQELFELLSSFIKINSESFATHGNEENMAKELYAICQELGLKTEMYSPLDIENIENHPDYMPGRNLENRYNVTAVFEGDENIDELMLMGHTDTVEIGDRANWRFDPLSGEIKDGKILGRGACDDKYALAATLFIIKLLKEEGFKPKKNLVFAAYSDEEYGGSHGALAAVLKNPCNKIVNLDGRKDQIWHCGSGGMEVKYTFHADKPIDSSKATAKAMNVVFEVMEQFDRNRYEELEANRFYKGTCIPKTSNRYIGVRAGHNGLDLGVGELHFVFYTDKTKEEITAEFKVLEEILKERLAPLGFIGGSFKPNTRFFHYVFCEPDSEDIKTLVEASKEAIGIEPLVCGSCLSDLSVISKYGNSSAFAYGAGSEFATDGGPHQPNEYIKCEDLLEFTKTIATYVLKVLG